MKYAVKLTVASAAALALSGCGASKQWGKFDEPQSGPVSELPPVTTDNAGVSDFPQKIGDTYKVGGTSYTPQDVASYDEVGYASWYGQELAGNATANGERFNPEGISAAHKTLPLPTYVEVTALDTGRTILLRINDRGPFANDRLIDLSHGAAKQLGIDQQGVAGVRVRKVNPNEQERAVLRAGGTITERIPTPESLLSILRKNLSKFPRPAAVVRRSSTPAINTGSSNIDTANIPPSSGSRQGRFIVENTGPNTPTIAQSSTGNNYVGSGPGTYVVQVAAFGSKSRADSMARKIGAKVMPGPNRKVWRVRYGPYDSQKAAQSGLAQAQKRGYNNARILRGDK